MKAEKLSKVAQAYKRSEAARKALHDVGARCMEVTEDKAGIVWERYSLATATTFLNLVLFATLDWWDVFTPLTSDTTIDGTITAIKALQK